MDILYVFTFMHITTMQLLSLQITTLTKFISYRIAIM